jgi:DNA-binding CsgD family transcriptional regulator
MTSLPDEIEQQDALRTERLTSASIMLMLVCFILFDIFDDWHEGLASYHILIEVVLGLSGLLLAGSLFYRWSRQKKDILGRAHLQVAQAKRMASEWQVKASNLRSGLSQAISEQLDAWHLTDAEKEISFLLLKGFSLQEIADLRKTSERTVRQQASIIYKKSALPGRIQLAAFFMEDLLVPSGK